MLLKIGKCGYELNHMTHRVEIFLWPVARLCVVACSGVVSPLLPPVSVTGPPPPCRVVVPLEPLTSAAGLSQRWVSHLTG